MTRLPTRRAHRRRAALLPLLLLALLPAAALAACGGGGGEVSIVAVTGTPTPSTTPDAGTERDTPLPAPPERLLAGGTALAAYLAGGDADLDGCLPELVDRWQLGPVTGPRCVTGDLDGDREAEFAFLVTTAGGEGDVWFFDDAAAGRRLISSARVLTNAVLSDVVLHPAQDLTGDGEPEVVVTATTCGGDTDGGCTPRLVVASGHLGRLADLVPAGLDLAAVDSLAAEDVTGDGIADLVIDSGTAAGTAAGAAAASPPRDTRVVLHWAGVSFFVEREGAAGTYLVYAVLDADDAYARGDLAAAGAAYEAAATDPALLDWHAERGDGNDRRELVPYALFRAALAAIRQGDRDTGAALLDRAVSGHEASVHGEAAASFRVGWSSGLTLAQACGFATTAIRERQADFARAWDFGPEVTAPAADTICR